mmetsp:Transcript_102526/g.320507  ORF Transcript_102526/g.320507 Transcript_102526/m.320507 type:complete len:224 (-) Transcript_102526:105-776(-)
MEADLGSRLQELLKAEPSLGYRALHARLKDEPAFQGVSLKKVQTALQQLRQEGEMAVEGAPAAAPAVAEPACAGPGENIWTAASDGDISRVEELMQVEGFTPTSKDENGYTPVHAAAAWARVELLRLLLQRDGAAANVRDEDGDTPLHHVAISSELELDQIREVVGLLLESRADPRLKNDEGLTCLDACGQAVLDAGGGQGEEEPELNLNFIRVLSDHGITLE